MRYVWSLMLLPLFIGSGCMLPAPSRGMGFHFEVDLPSTIESHTPVQQSSGPLMIGGVGSGPVAGAVTSAMPGRMMMVGAPALDSCSPATVPYGSPGPSRPSPTLAQLAQGGCDLDDVCRRLDRQEQLQMKLLQTIQAHQGEAIPMPKGVP